MARYKPDFEGNGRNVLTQDRNTFGILNIMNTSEENKSQIETQFMKEYIEAYFCINVDIILNNKYQLKLEKTNKKLNIVDELKQLEFPIRMNKHQEANVLDVLDVLTEYIPNNHFSVLVLFPYLLFEPGIQNQIYGRAYGGDRVAVITSLSNEKEYIVSGIHELLHTFGIDHCNQWKCIMNSFDNNYSHLCPLEMRKLQSAIGFNILEREQKLINFYTKYQWKEEIKFTTNKIQILKEIENK